VHNRVGQLWRPAAQLLLGMVSENMGDYATAVRMLAAVPGQVREQPEAIAAYLYRHKLASLVQSIAARPPGRPDLMKPKP